MAGKVKFDGEAGSVELNRITAKKNYASSMQSHKQGATYAFDAILHKLAEEKYPDLANEVNGPVAVKQLPALTFQETLVEGTEDKYNQDYIGNFTVGADKGDKGYFGFENDIVKDTGIRLEGTDHLRGVGFNYPWEVNGVKNIRYNADKEALCIVTGNDPSKWTAILEQSATGNKKSESDIEAFLEQEFRPAFECAYRANPLLVGTTLTLEAMNANIDSFGNQRRDDGRLYSYCEVWRDGEYDLYYLNQERGQYEKNGVNLYDDLSDEDKVRFNTVSTLEEKNDIFIHSRIERFANEVSNYFCLDDLIYQYTFLLTFVASDNFEKNMYPYKMKLLQDGSRWRFFQDDLDSIGPTDNQAQDTKSYSVEFEDFTDESQSAYVFKGEDSALWQAVNMAFPDRIRRMGRDILQAMYDLSPTGTQTLEKLMGFFDEYFFSRAQNYFPPSAYNNDAEIAYEEAWNNKDYVASVDIHPLAQSLGDHNLAERQYWEKRMLYLMSKFGFGGYGSYEDKELGVISFRTQTAQSFTLTPAIDSYPTILGGASQISSSSERVKAGVPVTLPAVGGNNTNTYIAGADWLADIGDLKDLKVDPSMVLALNVGSKRLQRLKVGDEDASAVTSTLEALAVQSCPSLTQVDARNLETLTGSVNLSCCPRLREAMFGGTNVTTVTIAAGSKIEHLQLPDSVTVLDLRNTKFLSNFELGDYTHIGFLRLENNKYIDGFSALKNAYADGGGSLQNVRIVGFNYAGDSTDADFLASLADGVYGIDSEGNPTIGKPVIEGTLNIAGSIYEDSAEAIRANYPNLTLIVEGGYYIRFADPVVQEICATNWGDGNGITKEQAAKVTTFGTHFQNNTEITTFDEAKYFTALSNLNSAFITSSLKELILDFEGQNINEIDLSGICRGCASLERVVIRNAKIKFSKASTSVNHGTFHNCPMLKEIIIEDCDTSSSDKLNHFISGAGVEDASFLVGNDWSNVVELRNFAASSSVKHLTFPAAFSDKLTTIAQICNGTQSLETLDLSNLVWDNVVDYALWVAAPQPLLSTINVGQGMCKAAELNLPALYGTYILKRIDGYFDAGNTTKFTQQYGAGTCRRVEIRNIGKRSELTAFKMTIYGNWGVNSEEVPDAQQSIVSTFNHLYDRASVGHSACTITLSANSLASLEEGMGDVGMWNVLQKGYTIVNYSPYITFEDQAVADIVIAKWGDGTNIAKAQAALATTGVFAQLFRNNTSVTKFNEARYFKQPISLNVFADGATNFSEITLADGVNITSGYYAFRNTALTKFDAPNMVVTGTDISGMFTTSPIVSIPTASTWDVSRVTNMAYLFKDCANLIGLDVSKWNVSNVTDMGAAFQNCTSLQSIDLSKWEFNESVTINSLLDGASLINNISIRENITLSGANYAFRNCPLEHFSAPNLKIKGWARGMFFGAGNGGVLDLTSWDMSECTSIKGWGDGMFASSKFDEINIAGWDLVNKGIAETNSNGGNLFTNCTARKINLTGCNTKGLVGLAALFSGCSNLEEILGFSDLDLSSVTTISNLISGTKIKHWDFSKNNLVALTSMQNAFGSTPNVESYNFGDYGFGKNATTWYVWLHYGSNYQLRKCYGHLDASGATKEFPSPNNAGLLRRFEMRGIGTHTNWTAFSVSRLSDWGAPDPDGTDPDGNLQSMIDTLLTYSFDRAAAGYATCTISLHANALARLLAAIGDSGMLQIINKGYTITNYTPAG